MTCGTCRAKGTRGTGCDPDLEYPFIPSCHRDSSFRDATGPRATRPAVVPVSHATSAPAIVANEDAHRRPASVAISGQDCLAVTRSQRTIMRSRLTELAVLFLRLGILGFGGPAAHIAMMRDEVVRRRRWMTDQAFRDPA